MNIGELKELIKDLPDNTPVLTESYGYNKIYTDGGAYIRKVLKHKDYRSYKKDNIPTVDIFYWDNASEVMALIV
ncbi:MAG: hypothetical protein AABY22_20450 [Nanoarchaeota archaeon]